MLDTEKLRKSFNMSFSENDSEAIAGIRAMQRILKAANVSYDRLRIFDINRNDLEGVEWAFANIQVDREMFAKERIGYRKKISEIEDEVARLERSINGYLASSTRMKNDNKKLRDSINELEAKLAAKPVEPEIKPSRGMTALAAEIEQLEADLAVANAEIKKLEARPVAAERSKEDAKVILDLRENTRRLESEVTHWKGHYQRAMKVVHAYHDKWWNTVRLTSEFWTMINPKNPRMVKGAQKAWETKANKYDGNYAYMGKDTPK